MWVINSVFLRAEKEIYFRCSKCWLGGSAATRMPLVGGTLRVHKDCRGGCVAANDGGERSLRLMIQWDITGIRSSKRGHHSFGQIGGSGRGRMRGQRGLPLHGDEGGRCSWAVLALIIIDLISEQLAFRIA